MTIRVESISNSGEYLEVAWANEADVDYRSGVVEMRISRIPQDAIPQELIAEFVDCGIQLLDAARVHRHRVADSFTAPR
jgi:hypothetical protein